MNHQNIPFADAVVSSQKKASISTDKPAEQRSADRKKRVFTIFSLASTEPSELIIIDSISQLFICKPAIILKSVQRDTRFRSKHNILFYHEADCNYLKRNGITIAGQRIKCSLEKARERRS